MTAAAVETIPQQDVFVLFDVLRPSQQLWSCRNGPFT